MNEEVINGFGKRLSRVELDQGRLDVKVLRNEKDISQIWDGIGQMQKTVNGILWKVAVMIMFPTVLLLIKFLYELNGK